jgi:NAD(P)-dependent dehydrogenase (short-subunit alcohol dehydrogenase family)
MRRILITGASRGIGRAIAEKLAAPDVTLLLHGRDTIALAETRKAVEPKCAKAVSLIHDLATPKGVSNLILQVGDDPLNHLDGMGPDGRREYQRAISADATFCRPNAAWLQHRKYSFDCGQDRFSKLERLLHE